jgi:ribonuclease HI
VNPEKSMENSIWKMFFDGSCSKDGYGVGIVFISPDKEVIPLSYKLKFETTNNIAEYEALLLGLKDAKDMGIDKLAVFGDSELVIHQVKNLYQIKKPTLKQYMNEIWTLLKTSFWISTSHLFRETLVNKQITSISS